MEEPIFIPLNTLPLTPHPTIQGVETQFFQNAASYSPSDVLVAHLQAGGVIPWHHHPEDCEIAYVLQGSATLLYAFSEERSEVFEGQMLPGVALIIPKGVWHSVTNKGDETLLAFAIHTP